jgi:hypothetical protein
LGFNITGSKDSTLKVIGNATSANNSSGVVMNAAINGFKEVTILGSRPASSTGNAVLINSDLKANGNVLIQANGGQITQSNRTLSSANGWITIDNSNSQNVDPSTGKINEKGTATAQVNAITLSGVVSAGTDKNLNIHGQGSAAGVVIASGRLSAGRDVNITGEGVNERGVLSYEAITNVKPNIEAKNGDVNITGKSTSQTAISLESATGLVTAGNSIVLKGDKQYLGTLINTEGTVTIQATTPNRSIALGADDAPEKLGISQPELNQITAKNLIVGNTSSNGKISVETGITTKIATGDLTLQTGGDIEFKAALNVGVDVSGNTPSKKLTLNAGGKVAQDASAAIKATELQLAGGSGTYLLNNPSNTIGKISGSAMKIEFKNIGDLNVGSATETLDAKDGLTILTGGNLDIQNKITNTNNNDVILAAGYGHAAESGLGNNILTNGRAIVSNGSRSIRLYTGSTTGTGKLANLHSSLDKLDLEAGVTSTDTKQNTMTGASFLDAQSIEGGANVQAFFREKVAFTTTFNAPNAPVTKNYGEFGTKNEGTQLADTVKSALKGANTGNASVATANGNAFQIKKSTLIDNMTFDGGKALATTDQSFSTSNHLKASDTTYKSSKMTTNNSAYTLGDVAAETVQVKVTTAVAPKPPTPVVTPTDSTRVKVPVGAANPFQLASAEDLADEVCSANSLENCYCEESPLTPNVDICYEPKTSGKGPAR